MGRFLLANSPEDTERSFAKNAEMSSLQSKVEEIQDKIGLLQKNFECAICLELMKNPVSTKCDHKFCRHCILLVFGNKGSVLCPVCRETITKRSLSLLEEWNKIVTHVAELVKGFELDTGACFSPRRGASIPLSQTSRPDSSPSTPGRSGGFTPGRSGGCSIGTVEQFMNTSGEPENPIEVEDSEASSAVSLNKIIRLPRNNKKQSLKKGLEDECRAEGCSTTTTEPGKVNFNNRTNRTNFEESSDRKNKKSKVAHIIDGVSGKSNLATTESSQSNKANFTTALNNHSNTTNFTTARTNHSNTANFTTQRYGGGSTTVVPQFIDCVDKVHELQNVKSKDCDYNDDDISFLMQEESGVINARCFNKEDVNVSSSDVTGVTSEGMPRLRRLRSSYTDVHHPPAKKQQNYREVGSLKLRKVKVASTSSSRTAPDKVGIWTNNDTNIVNDVSNDDKAKTNKDANIMNVCIPDDNVCDEQNTQTLRLDTDKSINDVVSCENNSYRGPPASGGRPVEIPLPSSESVISKAVKSRKHLNKVDKVQEQTDAQPGKGNKSMTTQTGMNISNRNTKKGESKAKFRADNCDVIQVLDDNDDSLQETEQSLSFNKVTTGVKSDSKVKVGANNFESKVQVEANNCDVILVEQGLKSNKRSARSSTKTRSKSLQENRNFKSPWGVNDSGSDSQYSVTPDIYSVTPDIIQENLFTKKSANDKFSVNNSETFLPKNRLLSDRRATRSSSLGKADSQYSITPDIFQGNLLMKNYGKDKLSVKPREKRFTRSSSVGKVENLLQRSNNKIKIAQNEDDDANVIDIPTSSEEDHVTKEDKGPDDKISIGSIHMFTQLEAESDKHNSEGRVKKKPGNERAKNKPSDKRAKNKPGNESVKSNENEPRTRSKGRKEKSFNENCPVSSEVMMPTCSSKSNIGTTDGGPDDVKPAGCKMQNNRCRSGLRKNCVHQTPKLVKLHRQLDGMGKRGYESDFAEEGESYKQTDVNEIHKKQSCKAAVDSKDKTTAEREKRSNKSIGKNETVIESTETVIVIAGNEERKHSASPRKFHPSVVNIEKYDDKATETMKPYNVNIVPVDDSNITDLSNETTKKHEPKLRKRGDKSETYCTRRVTRKKSAGDKNKGHVDITDTIDVIHDSETRNNVTQLTRNADNNDQKVVDLTLESRDPDLSVDHKDRVELNNPDLTVKCKDPDLTVGSKNSNVTKEYKNPESVSQNCTQEDKVDRWLDRLPDSVSPLLSAEAINVKSRCQRELLEHWRKLAASSQECHFGDCSSGYQLDVTGSESSVGHQSDLVSDSRTVTRSENTKQNNSKNLASGSQDMNLCRDFKQNKSKKQAASVENRNGSLIGSQNKGYTLKGPKDIKKADRCSFEAKQKRMTCEDTEVIIEKSYEIDKSESYRVIGSIVYRTDGDNPVDPSSLDRLSDIIEKPDDSECTHASKPDDSECTHASKPDDSECTPASKPADIECTRVSKPADIECTHASKPVDNECTCASKSDIECTRVSKSQLSCIPDSHCKDSDENLSGIYCIPETCDTDDSGVINTDDETVKRKSNNNKVSKNELSKPQTVVMKDNSVVISVDDEHQGKPLDHQKGQKEKRKGQKEIQDGPHISQNNKQIGKNEKQESPHIGHNEKKERPHMGHNKILADQKDKHEENKDANVTVKNVSFSTDPAEVSVYTPNQIGSSVAEIIKPKHVITNTRHHRRQSSTKTKKKGFDISKFYTLSKKAVLRRFKNSDSAKNYDAESSSKCVNKIFKRKELDNYDDLQNDSENSQAAPPVAFVHSSPVTDDPYAFKMSQRTPKQKRMKLKGSKRSFGNKSQCRGRKKALDITTGVNECRTGAKTTGENNPGVSMFTEGTEKADGNDQNDRSTSTYLRENTGTWIKTDNVRKSDNIGRQNENYIRRCYSGKSNKSEKYTDKNEPILNDQAAKNSENETEKEETSEMKIIDENQMDKVSGNQMDKVHGNQMDKVNGNQMDKVNGNQMDKVHGNQMDKVNGNRMDKVHGNRMDKVHGNRMDKVHGNQMDKVHGNQVDKVHGNQMDKVHGNQMDKVHGNQMDKVNGNQMDKVNGNRMDKVGVSESEELFTDIESVTTSSTDYKVRRNKLRRKKPCNRITSDDSLSDVIDVDAGSSVAVSEEEIQDIENRFKEAEEFDLIMSQNYRDMEESWKKEEEQRNIQKAIDKVIQENKGKLIQPSSQVLANSQGDQNGQIDCVKIYSPAGPMSVQVVTVDGHIAVIGQSEQKTLSNSQIHQSDELKHGKEKNILESDDQSKELIHHMEKDIESDDQSKELIHHKEKDINNGHQSKELIHHKIKVRESADHSTRQLKDTSFCGNDDKGSVTVVAETQESSNNTDNLDGNTKKISSKNTENKSMNNLCHNTKNISSKKTENRSFDNSHGSAENVSASNFKSNKENILATSLSLDFDVGNESVASLEGNTKNTSAAHLHATKELISVTNLDGDPERISDNTSVTNLNNNDNRSNAVSLTSGKPKNSEEVRFEEKISEDTAVNRYSSSRSGSRTRRGLASGNHRNQAPWLSNPTKDGVPQMADGEVSEENQVTKENSQKDEENESKNKPMKGKSLKKKRSMPEGLLVLDAEVEDHKNDVGHSSCAEEIITIDDESGVNNKTESESETGKLTHNDKKSVSSESIATRSSKRKTVSLDSSKSSPVNIPTQSSKRKTFSLDSDKSSPMNISTTSKRSSKRKTFSLDSSKSSPIKVCNVPSESLEFNELINEIVAEENLDKIKPTSPHKIPDEDDKISQVSCVAESWTSAKPSDSSHQSKFSKTYSTSSRRSGRAVTSSKPTTQQDIFGTEEGDKNLNNEICLSGNSKRVASSKHTVQEDILQLEEENHNEDTTNYEDDLMRNDKVSVDLTRYDKVSVDLTRYDKVNVHKKKKRSLTKRTRRNIQTAKDGCFNEGSYNDETNSNRKETGSITIDLNTDGTATEFSDGEGSVVNDLNTDGTATEFSDVEEQNDVICFDRDSPEDIFSSSGASAKILDGKRKKRGINSLAGQGSRNCFDNNSDGGKSVEKVSSTECNSESEDDCDILMHRTLSDDDIDDVNTGACGSQNGGKYERDNRSFGKGNRNRNYNDKVEVKTGVGVSQNDGKYKLDSGSVNHNRNYNDKLLLEDREESKNIDIVDSDHEKTTKYDLQKSEFSDKPNEATYEQHEMTDNQNKATHNPKETIDNHNETIDNQNKVIDNQNETIDNQNETIDNQNETNVNNQTETTKDQSETTSEQNETTDGTNENTDEQNKQYTIRRMRSDDENDDDNDDDAELDTNQEDVAIDLAKESEISSDSESDADYRLSGVEPLYDSQAADKSGVVFKSNDIKLNNPKPHDNDPESDPDIRKKRNNVIDLESDNDIQKLHDNNSSDVESETDISSVNRNVHISGKNNSSPNTRNCEEKVGVKERRRKSGTKRKSDVSTEELEFENDQLSAPAKSKRNQGRSRTNKLSVTSKTYNSKVSVKAGMLVDIFSSSDNEEKNVVSIDDPVEFWNLEESSQKSNASKTYTGRKSGDALSQSNSKTGVPLDIFSSSDNEGNNKNSDIVEIWSSQKPSSVKKYSRRGQNNSLSNNDEQISNEDTDNNDNNKGQVDVPVKEVQIMSTSPKGCPENEENETDGEISRKKPVSFFRSVERRRAVMKEKDSSPLESSFPGAKKLKLKVTCKSPLVNSDRTRGRSSDQSANLVVLSEKRSSNSGSLGDNLKLQDCGIIDSSDNNTDILMEKNKVSCSNGATIAVNTAGNSLVVADSNLDDIEFDGKESECSFSSDVDLPELQEDIMVDQAEHDDIMVDQAEHDDIMVDQAEHDDIMVDQVEHDDIMIVQAEHDSSTGPNGDNTTTAEKGKTHVKSCDDLQEMESDEQYSDAEIDLTASSVTSREHNTSSSALSTQSDLNNTEAKDALVADVHNIEDQIQQLEAQLKAQHKHTQEDVTKKQFERFESMETYDPDCVESVPDTDIAKSRDHESQYRRSGSELDRKGSCQETEKSTISLSRIDQSKGVSQKNNTMYSGISQSKGVSQKIKTFVESEHTMNYESDEELFGPSQPSSRRNEDKSDATCTNCHKLSVHSPKSCDVIRESVQSEDSDVDIIEETEAATQDEAVDKNSNKTDGHKNSKYVRLEHHHNCQSSNNGLEHEYHKKNSNIDLESFQTPLSPTPPLRDLDLVHDPTAEPRSPTPPPGTYWDHLPPVTRVEELESSPTTPPQSVESELLLSEIPIIQKSKNLDGKAKKKSSGTEATFMNIHDYVNEENSMTCGKSSKRTSKKRSMEFSPRKKKTSKKLKNRELISSDEDATNDVIIPDSCENDDKTMDKIPDSFENINYIDNILEDHDDEHQNDNIPNSSEQELESKIVKRDNKNVKSYICKTGKTGSAMEQRVVDLDNSKGKAVKPTSNVAECTNIGDNNPCTNSRGRLFRKKQLFKSEKTVISPIKKVSPVKPTEISVVKPTEISITSSSDPKAATRTITSSVTSTSTDSCSSPNRPSTSTSSNNSSSKKEYNRPHLKTLLDDNRSSHGSSKIKAVNIVACSAFVRSETSSVCSGMSSAKPSPGVEGKGALDRGAEVKGQTAMWSPSLKPDHFPKRPNWMFIASGILRVTERPYVMKLVQLLGCHFLPKYQNAVTHVLVKADAENPRLCPRTLKYFQGIAGKCWILNVNWAIDCVKEKQLLPEEPYEIQGDTINRSDIHQAPLRARQSKQKLLKSYQICFKGDFDMLTTQDLRSLAESCGASTLNDPRFSSFSENTQLVVIVERKNALGILAELKSIQRLYRIPVVNKEWLLDSIGSFQIEDIEDYTVL